VKDRNKKAFAIWLERAQDSELRGFAFGIRRDQASVEAALSMPWSNGQTEGQVHRLKLLKRQMYGRAKLDLLKQRLLYAA
jgi:transposase